MSWPPGAFVSMAVMSPRALDEIDVVIPLGWRIADNWPEGAQLTAVV